MKNLFFMASLLPLFLWGQQQEPMFQTTVYFEDAIGNRDSIVVGMDTTANWVFNPQFGEVDNQTPFDSVFEVRSTNAFNLDWGDEYSLLSKRLFTPAETPYFEPYCYTGGPFTFLIQAKYQPVTISWDQGFFQNECRDGAYMTPDKTYELVNPWDWWAMPDIRFSCQEISSSYTLFLGDEYRSPYETPYIKMHEVMGSGALKDSIYGVTLWINPFETWTPCYQVSVEEVDNMISNSLKVFPNPARGSIQIEGMLQHSFARLSIIDLNGNIVFSKHNHPGNVPIEVSHLPDGLYFIEIEYDTGMKKVGRFVKFE